VQFLQLPKVLYPRLSQRHGETGLVIVRAYVGTTGGAPHSVILGDLNAEPGSLEMAMLADAGLIDAWSVAGGGPGYTWRPTLPTNASTGSGSHRTCLYKFHNPRRRRRTICRYAELRSDNRKGRCRLPAPPHSSEARR
jgi:hypothetical protein